MVWKFVSLGGSLRDLHGSPARNRTLNRQTKGHVPYCIGKSLSIHLSNFVVVWDGLREFGLTLVPIGLFHSVMSIHERLTGPGLIYLFKFMPNDDENPLNQKMYSICFPHGYGSKSSTPRWDGVPLQMKQNPQPPASYVLTHTHIYLYLFISVYVSCLYKRVCIFLSLFIYIRVNKNRVYVYLKFHVLYIYIYACNMHMTYIYISNFLIYNKYIYIT